MYKENDAQLRAKRIFFVIDRHHNTIHRDYNRYRRRERGDLVVAKPRSIKYAYTQINASEKKKKNKRMDNKSGRGKIAAIKTMVLIKSLVGATKPLESGSRAQLSGRGRTRLCTLLV